MKYNLSLVKTTSDRNYVTTVYGNKIKSGGDTRSILINTEDYSIEDISELLLEDENEEAHIVVDADCELATFKLIDGREFERIPFNVITEPVIEKY